MILTEQTYKDIEEYLKKKKTIIIPLGSIEQHSASMPLGTDSIIAESIAVELGKVNNILVGPLLSPGISLVPHMEFKGTVSLMPNTFTNVISETIRSLYKHGFRNFILVNGHGGNDGAIKNAITELCYSLDDLKIKSENWWRMKNIAQMAEEKLGNPIGHACGTEASLILYINENLIKKDLLSSEFKNPPAIVSNNLSTKYLTKTGIINADQKMANKELGKKLFDMSIDNYTRIIKMIEDES
ncbi:MAG: creatininase family protein [Nanoarchaeota archaeon]|nr:creatininase family protein [Nanoarchaeota archaeon]